VKYAEEEKSLHPVQVKLNILNSGSSYKNTKNYIKYRFHYDLHL
jgi:hypothetical protein